MIGTDNKRPFFGHEKLTVYRKSLEFVTLSREFLNHVVRKVAACDHLVRAAESIPQNIAHASSTWSPRERIAYLGHANGSALECAACLDVLVAKRLLPASNGLAGKRQLGEVVSMLITMAKIASDKVHEDDGAAYSVDTFHVFSHERLDVYQAALQFTGWVEDMGTKILCSGDAIANLDKASTGIVLNIAEGNGRFSNTDQGRFVGIARRAVIQSASLLDLIAASNATLVNHVGQGRELLRRIDAMLCALMRSHRSTHRSTLSPSTLSSPPLSSPPLSPNP